MRRVVGVVVLLLAFATPGVARADVHLLGGFQQWAASATTGGGAVTSTSTTETDQLWVVALSFSDTVTTTSVTYKAQSFTRASTQTMYGLRNEFWILRTPDTSAPLGQVTATFSG